MCFGNTKSVRVSGLKHFFFFLALFICVTQVSAEVYSTSGIQSEAGSITMELDCLTSDPLCVFVEARRTQRISQRLLTVPAQKWYVQSHLLVLGENLWRGHYWMQEGQGIWCPLKERRNGSGEPWVTTACDEMEVTELIDWQFLFSFLIVLEYSWCTMLY